HLVYAPINSTIPVTNFTDSTLTAPKYLVLGVGGSACYASGNLDSDPQDEVIYVNSAGTINVADLKEKTVSALPTGPGMGYQYTALSIGNFLPQEDIVPTPTPTPTPSPIPSPTPTPTPTPIPSANFWLEFDGQNDFVKIEPNQALDLRDSLTLSVWARNN